MRSLQAADLWAIGITLYTFVYGRLPFHDENIVVLYDKIRTAPLTFPDEPFVSEDLRDLIAALLNKKPSERLTLPDMKVSNAVIIILNSRFFQITNNLYTSRILLLNDKNQNYAMKLYIPS